MTPDEMKIIPSTRRSSSMHVVRLAVRRARGVAEDRGEPGTGSPGPPSPGRERGTPGSAAPNEQADRTRCGRTPGDDVEELAASPARPTHGCGV